MEGQGGGGKSVNSQRPSRSGGTKVMRERAEKKIKGRSVQKMYIPMQEKEKWRLTGQMWGVRVDIEGLEYQISRVATCGYGG